VHKEGIERNAGAASAWKSYGCFLSDMGRRDEALVAYLAAPLAGYVGEKANTRLGAA
jgi:hypothetical protein